MIDDTMLAAYKRDGAVVARSAIEKSLLEELVDTIKDMVAVRMKSLGLSAPAALDRSFDALCNHDRSLGGEIYRAARLTPAYLRIVSHPGLEKIAAALMNTDRAAVVPEQCNLRIDRPGEDKFLLHWHQEYPYHLISQHAVVAWIPVMPMTLDMGPVKYVAGTHGKLRHASLNLDKVVAGNSTSFIKLVGCDIEELERNAKDALIEVGDVLLFHTFLLHRSAPNRGKRARWTIQIRYGDFKDSEFVSRGFSYQAANEPSRFGALHPNYVRSE
jgi:ectoine hydroxylase-related dioxygenase (phytanoyl-CoA dioxygenase family)